MKNKLKEIIKTRNIDIDDISQATEIGRTTIYQIMNAKCVTNVDYALRLANFLNLSVEELFFSDEE